jgi:hypothetical protein
MIVVGGSVVVVVVVVGGPIVVVVVVRVVVVVGGDSLAVVVVVVGGDFLVVVVVVVVATVVVTGREDVVVVVGSTGMEPRRLGADVGAVVALVVGALRVASKLPANKELTEAGSDRAGEIPVVVFAGVVVEVAESVLGAGGFVFVDEVGPLSDGVVSLCTNPT